MQQQNTIRAHSCFRLDIQFPIKLGQDGIQDERDLFELWHALSYRITRRPDDLLAHTRRIRLCQEPALHPKLLGALLDLEYVLGSRGSALKTRLRAECKHVLENSESYSADGPDTGSVLPTMQQLMQASSGSELTSPQ